jgi:hypothetical protein
MSRSRLSVGRFHRFLMVDYLNYLFPKAANKAADSLAHVMRVCARVHCLHPSTPDGIGDGICSIASSETTMQRPSAATVNH